MNTTRSELFKGCLIASISHAIMTNVYPDLSYEQSWDGFNYLMQNTEGLRGTITFDADYCVGAIRNETVGFIGDIEFIQKITSDFPLKVVDKAYNETLQYLLTEVNGTVVPCVTSMFWADNDMIHYQKENAANLQEDLFLFKKILVPEEKAINEWKEYYDMDLKTIGLLKYLYHEKAKCFTGKIVLNDKQKRLIPGDVINSECIESLKELNIYCE